MSRTSPPSSIPRSRPVSGSVASSPATSTTTIPRLKSASANPDLVASLKQKCDLLESNQKATIESSQWTVQQNRQILLALKAENKELKASLAKRTAGTTEKPVKSVGEKTIEKLEKDVHDIRRQHDKILQEKKTSLNKLENLQDTIKDMHSKANVVSNTPGARQIRSLENRLDKASLKLNEAQSIRRTYEGEMNRLKEERVHIEAQMKSMQELMTAKRAELEALTLSTRDAQFAKEQAKNDLSAAEETLATERAKREKLLEEQRQQLRALKQQTESLAEQKGALLATSATAELEEEGAGGEEVPEGQAARWAVRRLMSACGCTGPEALLDRLLSQQESYVNLQNMSGLAEKQLAELQEQVKLLRDHLQDLRAGGKLTTQAQLDAAEGDLKLVAAEAEAAREEYEGALRGYVDLRSGLDHLFNLTAPLPLPGGAAPVPLDDETVADVLAQCEQRLKHAQDMIAQVPVAHAMLSNVLNNPNYSFQAGSSADTYIAAAGSLRPGSAAPSTASKAPSIDPPSSQKGSQHSYANGQIDSSDDGNGEADEEEFGGDDDSNFDGEEGS